MHGGMSANEQMHIELQVALNFIISYLYNKLPRTRIHLYGEELEKLLRIKFQGHWYPSNPVKGSAYRCVHLNSTEIDPSFEIAAVRSGLDFVNDIKNNLPSELSVWVDPREVSYAIGGPDGKPGPVNVLYRHQSSADEPPSDQELLAGNESPTDMNSCSSYMTFNPHAKDFLPKTSPADPAYPADALRNGGQLRPERKPPATLNYSLRPARRLYTVDEFASTKFGSTKMKTHARNLSPFPRMHPSAYPNQPGFVNTSPTAPNPVGPQFNFFPDGPTESRMGANMFSPFQVQPGLSSLTTSSSFSESSSGSSTSSSPDHVKAQILKGNGCATPQATSPTSPWGDAFSCPVPINQPVDAWPQFARDFSTAHEDYLDFTRMRNFNPFSAKRPPVPSSNARIMSMAT